MPNKPAAKRILVIEDDRTLSRLIVDQLKREGFESWGANNKEEAATALANEEPLLVILDIRLPDANGIELITWLREHCPVVVLTAYGSIDQAVQAMHAGATEYMVKPVSRERLLLSVHRALENASLKRDVEFWQKQVKAHAVPEMVGESKAFKEIMRLISIVSKADTTVLIEGESGVGKELVAGAIHNRSARSRRRFVAIDCATLQENLLESELFGHERGAFTGAERKKEGLIEIAEGGTVFLDEIGEISPAIQAKLLRVLETGMFRRLGGTRDLFADARFVAATNRSLQGMVREGKFRGDLFYRLSAFVLTVPSLRGRKEDIPLIANHFLQKRQFLRHVDKRFDPRTLKALVGYSWPGNVRELRNVIERGLLMSGDNEVILPDHLHLPEASSADSSQQVVLRFNHEPTLEEIRDNYLSRLLQKYDGRRNDVARVMGVSERNMYRMIKKLDQTDPSGGGQDAL